MRRKSLLTGFLVFAVVVISSVASAQTDLAASIYGAFSGTTNGNGTVQSPSNAAGGILELRHIRNPLIGYEGTYSFNRANQVYSTSSFACPVAVASCQPPAPTAVSANAHEITGDWIASVHVRNLRPFALAGVGLLLDVPVNGGSGTSTTAKPVFVYGGGIDWGVLPHLGLRFQYRGNLNKSPDLVKLYTSTDAFTHTAEPMIGAYFRL